MDRYSENYGHRKGWVLGEAYSSYHGRVHIPNIDLDPDPFPKTKININSVCGNHIVVDESDMFDGKQ